MRTAKLTARQTLLWLDHTLYPTAPYHNLVLTVDLAGALDVGRFERAFAQLVRDNDALRLAVREGADGAEIVVDDTHAIALSHVALSEPAAYSAWLKAHCTRRLELGQTTGHATLVRLGPDEHRFVFVQHHIASDGTSLVEIAEQLAAHYNGVPVEAGPSILDYAAHEQGYRASLKGKRDADYWAGAVKGGVPPQALYGHARQSRAVGVRRLGESVHGELLSRFGARAGEAPFKLATPDLSRLSLLLTTLFAYLYRTSGNRLLAIGVPVKNRPARFKRTLALIMEQPYVIVEIDEGETIASLAEKVRKSLFEALRHAGHASSDRGVHYATLNLHPTTEPRFEGLSSKAIIGHAPFRAVHVDGAQGDLRDTAGLVVFDRPEAGELRLDLELHTDTFDEALHHRAVGHLVSVLRAITTDISLPLDAICLVEDAEARALLAAGRGAESPFAPDIVTRIREQATRRPDALAIQDDSEVLSYAEVEARTNQLARELIEHGVGAGKRVGIYVQRGVDEPLSMLAVLKAGGAYVPLDPSHPKERIELILEDAAPPVLLAHDELAKTLTVADSVHVVSLDREWPRIRERDASAPAVEAEPSQLAYVLFTSGSTGRPKGVEIPRHAFENFLQSMAHTPGMTEADRLLAITTITFDIAGLEMFLPLWTGGSIQIANRETSLDPALMKKTLEASPITVMQATPATWRLLVEAGFQGKPGLKMLCGGEALSPELAGQLVARGKELWNVYGPTETTVWSTLKRIEAGFDKITIGRSIDRTQTYVLDAGGRLAPEGVIGELCIGGDGVALGYLDRPDLTADRFIPNPYDPDDSPIYRTGDLARLLPNGELECLGRVDHQVKIRGFRIELGEIESVLRTANGVKDAVVVARRDGGPDPRLVAYWVGEPGAEQEPLIALAHQKLPHYMQPTAYVRLDAFPLNTNGKVDRKALPAPSESASSATARRSTRPTHEMNDHEARVAAIWCEVLGRSDVLVDEDFFALGGDSLLAVRLRDRVRQQLGVELPLMALFEEPTVARMTKALESQDGLVDGPAAIPLRRSTSERPPLFCLLGLALYQPLASALTVDCGVYGVHVPFAVNPLHVTPTLVPELSALYVDIIKKTRPKGPYHLGGLCFGGVVSFEVARQLIALGDEVLSVSLFDAMLPSAQGSDRQKQIIHFVRRAVEEPDRIRTWLEDRRTRMQARMRMSMARFGITGSTPAREADPEAVELDVLSPEAEAAAFAYESYAERIRARTLLFRATKRDFPKWMRIEPTYGWGKLTPKLDAYDIHGGHLEIMHAPHVAEIAKILDRVLG